MVREAIGTGKTTDEAIAAACAQLGVSRDDDGVSCEILEMPKKGFFKSTPAKVKVTVEEEAAPAVEEAVEEAAPVAEAKPEAAEEPVAEGPAAEEAAAEEPAAKAAEGEEVEVPIDPEENIKVKASIEYLTEVFAAMGVSEVSFAAVQKGEATILKVTGNQVSALIGRRGETMEALSYLASLVANRLPGDYIKLGLDVAGYRNKREADLEALAKRLCEKVIRTGRSYAVEPMNPYERRIIHSAVGKIEGVRSESSGEGPNRHVVIYSTDPNASNEPDRSGQRRGGRGGERNGRGGRGGRGGDRNGRGGRGGRGGDRNSRGGNRGGRSGGNRFGGPRPGRSSVPERSFREKAPVDAAPVAPQRAERINDADGFALYGKIEL